MPGGLLQKALQKFTKSILFYYYKIMFFKLRKSKYAIEQQAILSELEKEIAKIRIEIINLKITNETLFEAIAIPKASADKWAEIQDMFKNQFNIVKTRKSN